jgi:hypothetical protein
MEIVFKLTNPTAKSRAVAAAAAVFTDSAAYLTHLTNHLSGKVKKKFSSIKRVQIIVHYSENM